MGKNILILGANGFIGNALVKELCKDDRIEIYAMDLENNKLDHSLNNNNFHFEDCISKITHIVTGILKHKVSEDD